MDNRCELCDVRPYIWSCAVCRIGYCSVCIHYTPDGQPYCACYDRGDERVMIAQVNAEEPHHRQEENVDDILISLADYAFPQEEPGGRMTTALNLVDVKPACIAFISAEEEGPIGDVSAAIVDYSLRQTSASSWALQNVCSAARTSCATTTSKWCCL